MIKKKTKKGGGGLGQVGLQARRQLIVFEKKTNEKTRRIKLKMMHYLLV